MGFAKASKLKHEKHKKGFPNKKNGNKVEKTRKELRKEKRQQKKISRAMYYQKKKQEVGKFVKAPQEAHSAAGVLQKEESSESIEKKLQKENNRRKEKKLLKKKEKERQLLLKQANEQEDKVIKRLEKQLKLNRRKSKSVPKTFMEDGLDYILDFCDSEKRASALEIEKEMQNVDLAAEFKEDLTFAMDIDTRKSDEEAVDMSDASDSEIDENMQKELSSEINESGDDYNSDIDAELKEIESQQKVKENAKTKFQSNSMDDNDIDNVDQEDQLLEDDTASQQSLDDEGIWEDIYGRKRDRQGNVVSTSNKYIPPAARASTLAPESSQSEKLSRLKKQLKGLLNRLAEHNMHTIANEIDELYMSNSRNDMNEMLVTLMIEAIVSPVLTPNRLISEHIMLIAILHANVGIEVGAHFLLTLVRKFNDMLKIPQDVENKELDNLILMISHLYNFKVYGHRLLYEILEMLSTRFSEKEIELILLILRTVGFPLRKDDPIALKELILKLQQKAGDVELENSRVKFMLDVLLAIKNNNVSKIPQYDPSHVEHLKKIMKNFIRKGNSVTQFNISLEDLLHVNERGKWWVVGSAWSGSNVVGKQEQNDENKKPMFSQKILDLARKQRMNTDVRRNIFCVLMTAEDYLDAFEKLHHLGLKNQQEREVIYVIIDCCLQEKKFNPYYAVLAQKFCDYDRKYQMTIQYTLWDKLKILNNYDTKQLINFARFLTYLFLHKGLPFSVLKVIEFTELDKQTMRFLRQIILGILLSEDEETCLQVFNRISSSPQLHHFRESLRLFINHFLLKNIDSDILPQADSLLLKNRALLIDKILISRGSKVEF